MQAEDPFDKLRAGSAATSGITRPNIESHESPYSRGNRLKVVIVGGHGFVGSAVVEKLQSMGHEAVPVSRRNGVDLRDYAQVRDCFAAAAPDAIINCAANVGSLHYVTTHAAEVAHDNVQMALNIYRAVAEVAPTARIINPLANCSYPGEGDIYRESEWWNGDVHRSVYAYGNARRMLGVLAWCYAQQHAIRSVNFLVPNTFGPGDHVDPNKTHALNGMIIRMLKAHKNGDESFVIWGTGRPVREWAYIDDVVRVLVAGLTIERDLLEPVNVAQRHGYSISESAAMIAEAVGFEGNLVFDTSYQDGAPVKIMDNARFAEVFPGFVFTDHRDGILRTVRYYETVLDAAIA